MKTVKIRPEPPPLVVWLASNRATLLLLILLALSIVIYYRVDWSWRLGLLLLPTLLLAANFLFALITRGVMANRRPLLVFHLSLIALAAFGFAAQLSKFRASLELAVGEQFVGQLENRREGPWHRYALNEVTFTNLGFNIRYHAGIKREKTLNRIALSSGNSEHRVVEIGDHVPLVIGHYRFYTSHNKGYAPVFEWFPKGSAQAQTGSIHLPAFPAHRYGQALDWTLPGTDYGIWTMLDIEEEVLPANRAFDFTVPQQHRIVIRDGDRRYLLAPGDAVELPPGRLRYRELSSWMGYKVDYDWSRPWMLATALIGLLALFFHYLDKFGLLGGLPGARRSEEKHPWKQVERQSG